jgi:YD repeat-containing protein
MVWTRSGPYVYFDEDNGWPGPGFRLGFAGRLSNVTGSGFANVSTYTSNYQYRASGAVKYLEYGNGRTLDVGYNSRLQASSFTIPALINKTYQYQNDGRLKYSHDLLDQKFDRSYSYDQATRMTQALSGAEARGEAATNDRPYKQTMTYDAWDHMLSRDKRHWTGTGGIEYPAVNSYINNRNTVWSYDAAGNLLQTGQIPSISYAYDAAGNMTHSVSDLTVDITQTYDGDRQVLKRYEVDTIYEEGGSSHTETNTLYQLRSSALGGKVVTEVGAQGQKARSYVYANGALLALQQVVYVNGAPTAQQVVWEHRDSSNASYRGMDAAELDPFGSNAGLENPYQTNPPPQNHKPNIFYPAVSLSSDSACMVDGLAQNCGLTFYMLGAGTAEICPNNYCGAQPVRNPFTGEIELLPLTQDPNTGIFDYYPSRPPTVKDLLPKPLKRFASNRKLSDEECDKKLSSIFGGKVLAMETGDFGQPIPQSRSPHSASARNDLSATERVKDYDTGEMNTVRRADRGGILHSYTDDQASARADVPLFAPGGWVGNPVNYYQGGNSGIRFNYAGGISIEFVHVGTSNANLVPSVPGNRPDASGRVQIGWVGGAGGWFSS